jgi:membrane protease YdiL (CAAX protease family)
VPAVLVILTLLLWHLFARESWRVRLNTLITMAAESFIWALPIFGISFICQQFLPLTTTISKQGLLSLWSLSLGAGVYEELLFRLYLCGSIYLIGRHLFSAKPMTATIVAVLTSAVLFSLYHYLGNERFTLFSFVFRTLAGIYFAGLFSARGFGVTAGAHAFYDVIVVTLARSA